MQDKAIANIGKLQLKNIEGRGTYTQYIENMFPGQNYKILLMVFLIKKKNKSYTCSFKKIDIDTVNESSYKKYAYRKGSARGGDVTFTTKCTNFDKKKIETMINVQTKKLLVHPSFKNHSNEKEIFESLSNCFLKNKETIIKKLSAIYLNNKKSEKSGISVCFESEGKIKYLSDFKVIQDIILNDGTEGKSCKYGITSEGINNICSICLKKKPKLHGFASPFKYYSIDKRGFASNFFKQESSWKNYPICSECADEIEIGKAYITTNLKRDFYRNSYYIIPRIILDKKTDTLKKALMTIEKFKYAGQNEKLKHYEDEFLKIIAKEENYFNVDLLFFDEDLKTESIKIKLMIEEIFPSRFRTLFVDAPNIINRNPLFNNVIGKKEELSNMLFNFGMIKNFFENDFYDIIYKTFLGIKIDSNIIYTKFMNIIREKYNKGQSVRWSILESFMVLNYFQHLEIIYYNKNYKFEVNMDNEEQNKTPETKKNIDIQKLNEFITTNPGFFDQDYKVGIFSVGILVRQILNIQSAELKNTPFEKKLRGYNLNPEILKRIYLEALEKVSQYKSFFAYSNLRDFINKYYTLNNHLLNKISNNEISYYFVAGLEMGNNFKTEKEN